MNYLQSQIQIYVNTLLGTMRILLAAPIGWLVLVLFMLMFNFVSLLAIFLVPILGYMFLLYINVFIGANNTAHELSQESDCLYQNRSIDSFFAPFRADERFFGFGLGLCVILGMGLLAIVLHHLYQLCGGTNYHSTLPDFLFHETWRKAFVIVPMMWLWFAPSYHFYRGDNPIYAMAFSVSGCLKNMLSWAMLLASLLLPLLWLLDVLHPIAWLPIVSMAYLLLGICSEVHYRMAFQVD